MRTGYHAKRTPTESHTQPNNRSYGRTKSCLLVSVATVAACSTGPPLTGASCSPSFVHEKRRGASCQQSSARERKGAASRPDLCSCAAEAKQGDQVASGMRVVALARSELTCYTVLLGHLHRLERIPTAARSAAEAVSRAFGRAKFSLHFHSSEAEEPRVTLSRPWRTRCRCASREKRRASGRTEPQK
mgnify:FL=1